MSYCKVKNCNYSGYHLTQSHQCGNCNSFGHGQLECGNYELISNLKHISFGITLPNNLYCTSLFCESIYSHSSKSHQCTICQGRHFETLCNKPIHPTMKYFAYNEAKKILEDKSGKIFTEIYGGMGCQWFVKRNGINSPLSYFFMHTDNWGQYGPETDDTEKLKKFLEGYVHVETGNEFTIQ